MQSASRIFMVRPVNFGFNEQTAASNSFQASPDNQENVQEQALREFNTFVDVLKSNGVVVLVIDDETENHTPDSIFPNNWISTHDDGTLIIYPMEAENRRLERRMDIIKAIQNGYGYKHFVDLSFFEHMGKFLEGTGSAVLDRVNRIAYACLSSRTDPEVLAYFANICDYKMETFHAYGQNGEPVYHTNVMMSIGDEFVLICLEAVTDMAERNRLINVFESTGKEIIPITMEQMSTFAGNVLQLHNTSDEKLVILSSRAYESLTQEQISTLKKFGRLIHSPLSTIECVGGGSARCMIAEIHLPKNTNL